MFTAVLAVAGVISFQRMPVDAYPDLSPPMVELITQWPGHAAEKVERLVTLPIEVTMNGVTPTDVMRSISPFGLSGICLTFQEGTDDYFARQVVMVRQPLAVVLSRFPVFQVGEDFHIPLEIAKAASEMLANVYVGCFGRIVGPFSSGRSSEDRQSVGDSEMPPKDTIVAKPRNSVSLISMSFTATLPR